MKKILVCFLVLAILLLTGCNDSIYKTGDVDYYYESGFAASSFGTTDSFLYSKEFVKKFEFLDGEFDYYLKSGYLLGEYDVAILRLTYSPELYLVAKQDLFDNTEYVSDNPTYIYNGFEFYKKKSTSYENVDFYINAFDDSQNTIVFLGFYTNPKSNIDANVPEEEWPEFLRTYYGEYYDFDA